MNKFYEFLRRIGRGLILITILGVMSFIVVGLAIAMTLASAPIKVTAVWLVVLFVAAWYLGERP